MKISAKTKRILTIIAAVLVAAVLIVAFFRKNASDANEPDNTLEVVNTLDSAPKTSDTGEWSPSELPTIPVDTEDTSASTPAETTAPTTAEAFVKRDGTYTDKEHVAAYIHEFGTLPGNFVTKKEAEAAGWVSSKGNLQKVLPGKSIGGDNFGNFEKKLPTKKGRKYTECDIDYQGGTRNGKRIVFSNDGLIYYTGDHYETFTLLYGEE